MRHDGERQGTESTTKAKGVTLIPFQSDSESESFKDDFAVTKQMGECRRILCFFQLPWARSIENLSQVDMYNNLCWKHEFMKLVLTSDARGPVSARGPPESVFTLMLLTAEF